MAHPDETNPSTGETASETNPSTAATTLVGSRYTVLRHHAKGAMGDVFIAADHEFDREVAFKVIQEHSADTPASRAKFEQEAWVTGQLEHPSIVPVYNLGADSTGRPFYAMRLIRGTSLKEEVSRFHSKDYCPRGAGERTLRLRELLGRFIAVCNAIAYAHSRGVLHRDLKPANIMLGPFGETLLVDWGLAKLTGVAPEGADQGPVRPSTPTSAAPAETLAGSAVGTPSYMSPEQAEGRLDRLGQPTDVYGLGATLYHLLTGRPPVQGDDTGEVLRKVARGEFSRPRSIDRRVPRGLEAACLKAMKLRPGDRYQTAKALGDDLERWLADEPMSCYKDPLPRRIGRFARHHRKTTLIAFAGLVAVIVGGIIWSKFDRDRREAVRQRAEQLASRGEDSLTKGKDDDATSQLSEARGLLKDRPDLKGLRDRVDRTLARAAARTRMARFFTTTADAEEHILGSLWTLLPHEDPDGRRRINSRSEGPTKLEMGIARAREALALYGLPGDPAAAREPRDLEPEKATQVRSQAAETLFLLALAEERVGQARPAAQQAGSRDQACRLLDSAEALGNKTTSLYQYRSKFRKLVGRDAGADADRRLAERTPLSTFLDHHLKAVELARENKLTESATEYQITLAARPGHYWTLYRLAKTLENQKLLSQAEALYRNILALRPSDPTTHNTLGTILSEQGKNVEAIAEFEAVIRADPDYLMAYGNTMKVQGNLKQIDAAQATFRRFMTRKPESREQARAWDFLGIAYERARQDVKALEQYDEAVRLDPENPGILRNRSLCRSRLGRHADALDDIRRAIALQPASGELHYVDGLHFSNWGRDPKAAQSKAEAIHRIEQAVSAYGEAIRLGFEPARYNRGVMLRQLRRYAEALQDHDAILAVDPNNALALYERAMNHLHLKEFRVAINDLDRVLILDNPRAEELRLDAYRTRGKAWGDLGSEDDLKRSEDDLDRAVELDPNQPDSYRSRGLTRMRRGHASDPAKPETDAQAESCRGGIADYRKYLELRPNAPDVASILNDLNSAYLKLGRIDEAIDVLGQAIQREPRPSYYSNRGNIHMMRGNLEQAVADFDKAVSLDPKHTRAWALRGQCRLRQGRFDQAAKDLDRALELQPGFFETLVLRALANLGGGRFDAARRDLEIVARDRPNQVRGRFARGLLHSLDRRFPEAAVDLSLGMDDPILRPFGLPYRARAFSGLGTQGAPAAAADADELARRRPLDGFALIEAARIHTAAGLSKGRERAFDLLSQAIKRQPELKGGLGSDHDLKLLRTDGRFTKLLEKP